MSIEMKSGQEQTLQDRIEQIKKGGVPKYHENNARQGKSFVRDRLKLLFDPGYELEDAMFANYMAGDLPADGVVTAIGKVDEYLLKYEVSFRLVDKRDKMLSPPQTIRLQRDHPFDRLNVLAKEREEQELRRVMQRDAVQQILRRLSRLTLLNDDADKR